MLPENYQPASDSLANKVILITGAGAGIGKALAQACAEHGATTILLGRTVSKLEMIYDSIERAGLPQPAIYPLDLEGCTPNDYAQLAQTIRAEFGRLDGLVHNAAEFKGLTPIANLPPETWYRLLQINLNAPFLLTQPLLPLLAGAEAASIIFSTDSVCTTGAAYWGAYSVAKAGLQTLMLTLAQELETNTSIRVNCVDPGPARTDLRRRAYPVPDDATASPDAVVKPFLYLLGAEGRSVNGHIVSTGS